jgi:hypothetical protein
MPYFANHIDDRGQRQSGSPELLDRTKVAAR